MAKRDPCSRVNEDWTRTGEHRMKLADAALLGALGVLAWSQWQEWRLNRDDAIDIPYHGVPTASLWQCGLLFDWAVYA